VEIKTIVYKVFTVLTEIRRGVQSLHTLKKAKNPFVSPHPENSSPSPFFRG